MIDGILSAHCRLGLVIENFIRAVFELVDAIDETGHYRILAARNLEIIFDRVGWFLFAVFDEMVVIHRYLPDAILAILFFGRIRVETLAVRHAHLFEDFENPFE